MCSECTATGEGATMAAAWLQSACTQSADARRAHADARRAESVLIRSENPCPMCGGGGFHSARANLPFAVRPVRAWRRGRGGITLRYYPDRVPVEIRPDVPTGSGTCALSSVDGHTQFSRPVPGPSPAMESPGSGREPRTRHDHDGRCLLQNHDAFFTCLLHMPFSRMPSSHHTCLLTRSPCP